MFESERVRMVALLKAYGITDKRLLEAMLEIPRHVFIPDNHSSNAYDDSPASIGHGQTISQPYTVARMLELLEITEKDRILEVGSGSGYAAAILSKLCNRVIAVEVVEELADRSRKVIESLGITNVIVINDDASSGLIKYAPYDRILVSAAMHDPSPRLLEQLNIGGMFVAPIGNKDEQELVKMTKKEKGYILSSHGTFRFVPIIGEGGF